MTVRWETNYNFPSFTAEKTETSTQPGSGTFRIRCPFIFFNFFAYFICLDCAGSWLVHWAFPSCGEQGLRFLAVLSFLNVVASRCRDSRACRLQWLQCTGLVTPQHVGSPGTRDQTCVAYVDKWILNHWATREAPGLDLLCLCVDCCASNLGLLYCRQILYHLSHQKSSLHRGYECYLRSWRHSANVFRKDGGMDGWILPR